MKPAITFSTPLFCYLKDFVTANHSVKTLGLMRRLFNRFVASKSEGDLHSWFSNIYTEDGIYLGSREVKLVNNLLQEMTYESSGTVVSTSHIREYDTDHIHVIIDFHQTNLQISKYYQIIEADIVDCTTTLIDKTIPVSENYTLLGRENYTCPASSNTSANWSKVFSTPYWYCILWDAESNKVGNKEVFVYDDCIFIYTTYDNGSNSQYECLRKAKASHIEEYGSISRYMEYCKIYDTDKKANLSKGGILLGTSDSIEDHRRKAKKIKIVL